MRSWLFVVGLTASSASVAAQSDSASARLRPGGDGAIPLASFLLPGLGQYLHGEPLKGLAFSTLAVAGLWIGSDASALETGLPRTPRGQLRDLALEGYLVAGGLSAYDAFRHELPTLQRHGKYRFLSNHEPISRLLAAPLDPSFLKRWTTWIDLGYTAIVTAILVGDRTKPGERSLPFRGHDAGYAIGISAGAAWSEEALFRGWIFPYLQQRMGANSVLPNAIQAGTFATLHLPNRPGRFVWAIGGWALYEGWLTKRNGGSVRESVFHHFWYDAAVFVASLATETGPATLAISVPIRF